MRRDNPYPGNAPGPFYVGHGECIACGAPEEQAPDLMRSDAGGHCFFHRQPRTELEVERAIQAIRVSCCDAVRYAGDDPSILARIDETEDARRQRWQARYGNPDALPEREVPPGTT